MAELVVLGMQRAGARVNVVPFELDVNGISAEFQSVMGQSRPEIGAPTLYFCWPRPDLERFRNEPELFSYTMWESSRLPADWPARLNKMRAVIVPTRFCARVFRESGVEVPIEVVPLGIDPDIYHFHERPEREPPGELVKCRVPSAPPEFRERTRSQRIPHEGRRVDAGSAPHER